MRQIKVDITERHIRNGEKHSALSCPIALALTEKGYKYVRVDEDTAYWIMDYDGGEIEYCADLPLEAENFIIDFDDEDDVKPLSFFIQSKMRGPDDNSSPWGWGRW